MKPTLKIVDLIALNLAYIFSVVHDFWRQKCILYMVYCCTGRLGSSSYVCEKCDNKVTVSNACNNRNCPNCGAKRRAQWTDKLAQKLLPTTHFHLVFTLPHQLNTVIYNNQQEMLDIFMDSVAETLSTFTKTKAKKDCGGNSKNITPAFTQVLHTWTQKLELHYHIHVLMAGGCLANDKWVQSSDTFLFSICALGKVFKAKFLEKFESLIKAGSITTPGSESTVSVTSYRLPKRWNVYCAAPYNKETTALKYFAAYMNRNGISDSRIISTLDQSIAFWCRRDRCEKDPKEPSQPNQNRKICTLSVQEFLRRFCLHILPYGFRKIRHYGLYASAASKAKIAAAIKSLKEQCKTKSITVSKANHAPCCGQCGANLVIIGTLRIPVFKAIYDDTG